VALGTLLVRRSELQTIIGRDLGTLSPLRDRPNLMPPQPADLAQWVRSAEDTSYAVQIARGNYEIATREVQRQRDGHKPTLDLVGGYNVSKFNGTQSNEFINPRINTGTVGLQLNVPIYQGGLVQSRVREALSLQDRSNAELESARRSSANAARDAYTGVNFGLAQVRALESAEVSARTQLDSTQLGYQVGVRILLDVLNATTQLVQTQRDLKRARYDFLLAALRLKASSGALTEEDIAGVNALLDPAEPITIPDVNVPARGPTSSVPPAQPPARTPAKDGTTSAPPSSAPAAAPVAKPTSAKASKSARSKTAKRV
jgi:outer membrane protein